MGQLQAIVNYERGLSQTMTKNSAISDNMTQFISYHCCVYSGSTKKPANRKAV